VTIYIIDTEFGYRDELEVRGNLKPICACLVNLETGEEHPFWNDSFDDLRRFINDNLDCLFVAHNMTSEVRVLKHLSVPIPNLWYCTFISYRWLSNRRIGKRDKSIPPASLVAALEHFGEAHEDPIGKRELQERLGKLQYHPSERERILRYCLQDCHATATLFRHLRRQGAPCERSWTEYAKAVVDIEDEGLLIDERALGEIVGSARRLRDLLVAKGNHEYPFFDANGSLNAAQTLDWVRQRSKSWCGALTKKGALSLADKSLEKLATRFPEIENVRQIKASISLLKNAGLKASRGRSYFSVVPFRTITGRNAPSDFLFAKPKWCRFLVIPEPGHILLGVDYDAQEFGIAAALSGDKAMLDAYWDGDPHIGFAIRTGACPRGATKETHPAMRKRYKETNLAILYGKTIPATALMLGTSQAAAAKLYAEHQRLFPTFWDWSARVKSKIRRTGEMWSSLGWRAKTKFSSPRSKLNFAMQATGADIMRLSIVYLRQLGVRVLAPIHDGFLLTCRMDEHDDTVKRIDLAFDKACRQALGGRTLRWTVSAPYTQRYVDEDGQEMWDLLCSGSKEIGALAL